MCADGTLRGSHDPEVSMAKQYHLTIFFPPPSLEALTREVGIRDMCKKSRFHQLVVTEWGEGALCLAHGWQLPQLLPRAPAVGSSSLLASLPPRISLYP